jgi:peptide/nickel transport system substrate-binding protein
MRRLIAGLVLLALATLAFAGGTGEAAKPTTVMPEVKQEAIKAPSKFSEAPALAALVKAGKLPPVEQRLPEKPLVVKPVEKVGKYGGDWRVGHIGANLTHFDRYLAYEGLIRWSPGWQGIEPNLAERWTVNEKGNEFTFFLRKGVKWSDGAPWTADDIMFWYEGILLNKALTPAVPTWLRQGTTPVKVEKIDDYTVKFTFPEPNGLFLFQLAQVGGTQTVGTYWAKHYYSRFHPQYAGQEAVDKLAKEAGVGDWIKLMGSKGGPGGDYWRNSEKPVLHAWKLTLAPGEKGGTDQAIAERNPYYFKVDTAGNQLPYLDRVVINLVSDEQVLVLKILNGEIDMMDQFIATAANKPVFYDNQAKGGYHFFETTPTLTNTAFIQLNLNHADPVKKAIFNDKNFRIGLSYAINRKEIIELGFGGLGQPHQGAPRPDSPFWHEKLAKQYTEYDVAKANEYLDKALPKKDAQGFRLQPDGKRLTITFEVDKNRPEFAEVFDLVPKYWAKVGVEAVIKPMDRTLWEVRVRSQIDYDASIHRFGGGAGLTVLTDPRYYFPFNNNSLYAPAWALWYVNPTGKGSPYPPEEPPAPVKEQMKLYDQIKVTPDFEKQKAMMMKILDIAADQFFGIGISTEPNSYGIVKNNFKNVPKSMPWSWDYPHPGPDNPCQFFKE